MSLQAEIATFSRDITGPQTISGHCGGAMTEPSVATVPRWRRSPAPRCDAPGPRRVQLPRSPPARQLAPEGLSLARTGADRPGLPPSISRRGCASRLAPVLWDTIFQRLDFSWVKVASRSLRGPPPLLYEAHRRNIASIDRLGVWIGAPSGPSQPAAKRRI